MNLQSFEKFADELEQLLAVQPVPGDYRSRLREELLLAAQNEQTYRRGVSRRFIMAFGVVMCALVTLGGALVWRLLWLKRARLEQHAMIEAH